ncbi:MAG: RHS repeat-associated core domain-containing protein, partial [Ktedonobacterales bacterium]
LTAVHSTANSGDVCASILGSRPLFRTASYYYSYNGHGDVVALTDAGGTTVATYSYDTFGTPTSWESFSSGWHYPFLYDGHHGARYDSETGLYCLSMRAYDPTLGRFISRDPLGRAPLFFDPSGQWS